MPHTPDDFRCSDFPSQHDAEFPWTIERTPTGKALLLVPISSRPFGVYCHFFMGRTTPCRRDGCPACERKMLPRWSGYLLAVNCKNDQPIVFEYTTAAAPKIKKAFEEYGTIRGLSIVACRTSDKPNGKVYLEIKGMNKNAHKLPAEVPIWPVVSHIWGINQEARPNTASNFADDLSEAETIVNKTKEVITGHDDDWMVRRASDLAGQLVMPFPSNVKDLNGRSPHL